MGASVVAKVKPGEWLLKQVQSIQTRGQMIDVGNRLLELEIGDSLHEIAAAWREKGSAICPPDIGNPGGNDFYHLVLADLEGQLAVVQGRLESFRRSVENLEAAVQARR